MRMTQSEAIIGTGALLSARAARRSQVEAALLELSCVKELPSARVSELLSRIHTVYELAEDAVPWHAG